MDVYINGIGIISRCACQPEELKEAAYGRISTIRPLPLEFPIEIPFSRLRRNSRYNRLACAAADQADEFRVYIIDWLMPDLNGIETVRRIRKVIGDNTPIIILTAYDWADIADEAKEAGVTAFCSKPLFMSELRNVLTQPFMASQNTWDEKKEAADAMPDFTGERVLLAEDNEMNQMIAEAILTEHGFAVEIACDGEEAVEKMKAVPAGYYDIVLMDIQMPKMNGYEAAKQIRALDDKKKAGIPIVAVYTRDLCYNKCKENIDFTPKTLHFVMRRISMYKKNRHRQYRFSDFNQPTGLKMNPENRWVKKAAAIPWDDIEERYADLFPGTTGNPAKPLRMALGSLLIQKQYDYSDRELVEQIIENPYYQYFIGLPGYQSKPPFVPSFFV